MSSFFGYNQDIANATAILVTIPLLILVIKYLSSYIEKLKYEDITALLPFLLLPLAYYILEYAFTVYTDLLYTGGTVIIDFVDSFIVLLYLILSIFSLESANKKNKAEHEKSFFFEPQQYRFKKRCSRYPTLKNAGRHVPSRYAPSSEFHKPMQFREKPNSGSARIHQ